MLERLVKFFNATILTFISDLFERQSHNSTTLLWYRERQQQLDEFRKNLEKVQEEADILRSQLRTVQNRTQVLVQEWVQATNSVSHVCNVGSLQHYCGYCSILLLLLLVFV